MNEDIGSRLRILREQRNLSQRELAKRIGATNGLISRIERNQTSPTVSTLKRLMEGLELSVADFFTQDLSAASRIFYSKQELPNVGGKGIAFLLVAANRKGRAMSVLHETYSPGADTGEERYNHEGEEAGVIIRGEIEISVGDEVRVLSAGDAYYFESRLPHRFRNVGGEACEIVSACTPPTF